MSQGPTRLVVGPFNRVEGDLEVRLDVADGAVREAFVSSPLFRGFERILEGRDPRDALVIAPRICGICSVSQSHAAAVALAALQGIAPTDNGRVATNLILATENVADHLTHFHVFFMPDFARAIYEDRPWFATAARRFKAAQGESVRRALATRTTLLHVLGLLAGRWPHTLALQPGGVAKGADARDQMRLLATLGAVRADLEERLYGAPLEQVAELSAAADLDAWRRAGPDGDFRLFLEIAADLDLVTLGRAHDRFLSYGAYPQADGRLYAPGTFAGGRDGALDPAAIAEDHTFARMEGREGPHAPFEGSTFPDAADETGYTWCKAPRLSGLTFETGAFARQVVAGHPLARDLATAEGANVRSRVVGRLVETARTLVAMEGWVRELEPGAPWCAQGTMPHAGRAFGLTEAARGALGHWMVVEKGRIARYQIIAPTTWNFSPRDAGGQPGPLETALVGAPIRQGETTPVSVQHIVRSFDPCMVCTVH
ncbi:nickel-dependent hydrogenase large subunit [Xanthobacter dioxanivorans]|uniref:Nickel-dependent hydrogenase large subunit n=1 Tax=Xanthobacter dioxanivorans TaxID=2528964 RepID=A0A974PRH1_9HYPH|nr:nickel-dependent hydrogenase large subunit [Xanthobacter dioxanivorans]QRG07998.1 nickel-dependent hydrogenase large subunit [Xanthobacter dioxanivorans]